MHGVVSTRAGISISRRDPTKSGVSGWAGRVDKLHERFSEEIVQKIHWAFQLGVSRAREIRRKSGMSRRAKNENEVGAWTRENEGYKRANARLHRVFSMRAGISIS